MRFGEDKKAYTLIELVLVMALVTLVLGLALPRLGGLLGEDELKSASLRLLGLIREVRNRALVEQRYYRLYMESNTPNVWYEKLETVREKSEINKKRLSNEVTFSKIWIREKGTVQEGEFFVSFSPMGYTEESYIYLKDKKGRYFTLILNAFGTGIGLGEGELEPSSKG